MAAERQTATTVSKGHGRLETRTLTRDVSLRGYVDWPGLAQAFRLVRTRTIRGQTTRETIYGITSLPPEQADAHALLRLTRGHWGIENRVFHVRDVTLGEDACRVRTGAAPIILSVLRNAVLNLLRMAGVSNIAAALRRHAARPREALALIHAKDDF